MLLCLEISTCTCYSELWILFLPPTKASALCWALLCSTVSWIIFVLRKLRLIWTLSCMVPCLSGNSSELSVVLCLKTVAAYICPVLLLFTVNLTQDEYYFLIAYSHNCHWIFLVASAIWRTLYDCCQDEGSQPCHWLSFFASLTVTGLTPWYMQIFKDYIIFISWRHEHFLCNMLYVLSLNFTQYFFTF